MQVEHALPNLRAIVDHQAKGIANPELLRHTVRGKQQVTEQRLIPGIGIGQSRNLLLRNHQHVRRRLGIDVAERETQIVLIHDIGRDLAPDYLAEYGTHIPPFDRERDSSPIVRKG